MKECIYLDNNATTKPDPEVIQSVNRTMIEVYYNPSSIYQGALLSRGAIEDARISAAALIGAQPGEITLVSGGTEADNMALLGGARAFSKRGKHIITSTVEHSAVYKTCLMLEKEGFDVTFIGCDEDGLISPADFKKAIRKETILASIMLANNETGVIQPIAEFASLARENNVIFHTDAVQAAGKIRIDVKELGVDMLSLSGHKFYGPKGTGALYIRKGVSVLPVFGGGGQEKGLRQGTENTPAIAGFGKACELAKKRLEEEKDGDRIKKLRDMLENGILENIPASYVNGSREKRLGNTLNIRIGYTEGDSLLIRLDLEGICASAGSACASGSVEPSRVLTAMGLSNEEAASSIRFSIGRNNTEEEIIRAIEVIRASAEKLREVSPAWKGRVAAPGKEC
ncbi:MAG TPA: cysteine desulfurase [bacterium]|nr:cysteine desulfurase [bacterium]